MNKKLASFFCDPKTAIKNTAIFLLMVFLLVYTFYQILPNFADDLETETALAVTVNRTDKTTGVIFRDETPIEGKSGEAVTLIKDGERVSKGQLFANVYTDASSASYQEQINAIDRKIEILSKSEVDTDLYITDISKTDAEISENLDTLFALVAEGSLSEALSAEKALLVNLNKKELIINVTDGYSQEIAALRAEKAALESRIRSVSHGIYAADSGYFYGDTDGYERIFKPELLENMTLEDFRELTALSPEESVKSNALGKIVNDFVWHVVFKYYSMIVGSYEEGYYYNLRFPSFSDQTIKMRLERIVSVTSDEEALLIFRGNTAPEEFPYTRMGNVEVVREGVSGLAVPKQAVRIVGGLPGVFILDGDIVRFRYINILAEDGDYYIVTNGAPKAENADEPTAESTADQPQKRYLSLYDSIITAGKNLFDGKTVS